MTTAIDYCPVKQCRYVGHTADTCTFCLKADRDMWRREAETAVEGRKTAPPPPEPLSQNFATGPLTSSQLPETRQTPAEVVLLVDGKHRPPAPTNIDWPEHPPMTAPDSPARLLVVFDGTSWFVRKVRVIEHDLARDEKVYRCDEHVSGPHDSIDDAATSAKKYTAKEP